jgi:ligand-binding SRPBCC domain-containing protein
MDLYSIKANQYLPIDLIRAWNFFSNPRNLRQITPSWLDFKITNEIPDEMYPGMIITYRHRTILGLPTTWVTEITHVENPYCFVDEMRSGPFRFWHHQHHFKPISHGIEMTDVVHYALKLGIFGQLIHHVLIRAKLNEIFAFRKQTLSEIFGV